MSIRAKLHDTEFGNDFLVLTVSTQETNEQTDCLDSMETYKSVNQRTESTERPVTVSRDKAADPVSVGKCPGHRGRPWPNGKKVNSPEDGTQTHTDTLTQGPVVYPAPAELRQ